VPMHSILGSSEWPADALIRRRELVQLAQLVPANHPAGIGDPAATGRRIAGKAAIHSYSRLDVHAVEIKHGAHIGTGVSFRNA